MSCANFVLGDDAPELVDDGDETSGFLEFSQSQSSNGPYSPLGGVEKLKVKRLLSRTGPRGTAVGYFNIERRSDGSHWGTIAGDIYHTVLGLRFSKLLPLFMSCYMTSWAFFAVFWLLVSEPCHVGVSDFRGAFYLSMESMMTIGYGVPDPYFNDCWEMMPLLVTESLFGLLLDAAFLNTLFQRFSRAFARARTIIFSEMAVVASVDGELRFSFRVGEMRKNPLLEPGLRAYVIKHVPDPSQPEGVDIKMCPLLLDEPSQDIADGRLFMGLPVLAVHRVTSESPFAPPSTDGSVPSPESVKAYIEGLPFIEVMCFLSGSDAVTGNTIESRYSYAMDDFRWNHRFKPCISIARGVHTVNLVAFHETIAITE